METVYRLFNDTIGYREYDDVAPHLYYRLYSKITRQVKIMWSHFDKFLRIVYISSRKIMFQ